MADKQINFDELDWGTFTNTAQNYGYKKTELKDFAFHVLAHPKKYRSITRKRATFYINVLSNKRG